MSLDVYLYLDVDAGGIEPFRCEFFTANITHNLNDMADEAGIYQACWHTEDDPSIETASDLIPILESGLKLLESDRERFVRFEPGNRWGSYEGLVKFVRKYLQACRDYPKAKIYCCR